MKRQQCFIAARASVLACAALSVALSAGGFAAEGDGSDFAFNEMVQEMAGRDTGSQWVDAYVEMVNHQIASTADEPYGAAGPNGPLAGFDGYVAGFSGTDTGSMWFNSYVDSVKQSLKAKGY
jgi:hypothetical protein